MNIISIGLILLAWAPAANIEDRRGDPERTFLDFGVQLNEAAAPVILRSRIEHAFDLAQSYAPWPSTPLSRALGGDQLR